MVVVAVLEGGYALVGSRKILTVWKCNNVSSSFEAAAFFLLREVIKYLIENSVFCIGNYIKKFFYNYIS